MSQFIHIKSTKFPILPGEESELVNEGTYGKALAIYLCDNLNQRGYKATGVCCEDWGWWVSLNDAPFVFGVCIYSGTIEKDVAEYACTDGAPGKRKWSWRKFGFIDTSNWVNKLHSDLMAIFQADPEVEIIGVTETMPFDE